MKIAMIQNNYIIGDFDGNIKKIINNCNKNRHADIIVFSELCLSGYYPWDLVDRPSFDIRQNQSIEELLEFSKTIQSHIVIGLVRKNNLTVGKPFFNSLIVINSGKIVFDYDKKLLPTYNIFDEKRHFEEGFKSGIAKLNINEKETSIGFLICEDGWNDESSNYISNPVKDLASGGVSIMISINASLYNIQKSLQRDAIFGKISTRYGIPFVYVNQVGANDDIIFDGASFVFNSKGEKVVQMKFFEEDSFVFNPQKTEVSLSEVPSRYKEIFYAIITCLKDFCYKQCIDKIIVGSSGGVDSALTLALAKIALGADKVEAITMPSKYSSSGSIDDSVALCNNLGIKLLSFPIVNAVQSITDGFNNEINTPLTGVAGENLQARIRGTILMGYSNQKGNLLLTTGNKSEIAVGYFTLYGDSNGGLNLIGDLYKTEVYELCSWINEEFGELIPNNILTKAPSAELAPDQKDTDSLPDYPHLDAILKQELEWDYFTEDEKLNLQKLIDEVPSQDYNKIIRLIDRAEFKRKQSALIARLHPRAFGNGRKIPIVHK